MPITPDRPLEQKAQKPRESVEKGAPEAAGIGILKKNQCTSGLFSTKNPTLDVFNCSLYGFLNIQKGN